MTDVRLQRLRVASAMPSLRSSACGGARGGDHRRQSRRWSVSGGHRRTTGRGSGRRRLGVRAGRAGVSRRGGWSPRSASRFEDVGNGADPEDDSFEGDGVDGGELLRPVVVEQGEEPNGVDAQRFSPPASRRRSRVLWALAWRAARNPSRFSGPRWSARCRSSGMAGEVGLPVEVKDECGAGHEREPLSDVGVANRAEIEVEAYVGDRGRCTGTRLGGRVPPRAPPRRGRFHGGGRAGPRWSPSCSTPRSTGGGPPGDARARSSCSFSSDRPGVSGWQSVSGSTHRRPRTVDPSPTRDRR